jgi:hypothetical protein
MEEDNDGLEEQDPVAVSIALQLMGLADEASLDDRCVIREVQESSRRDSDFIVVIDGGRCYHVSVTAEKVDT